MMFQRQVVNLENSMSLLIAMDHSILLQLSADEISEKDEDEVDDDDR